MGSKGYEETSPNVQSKSNSHVQGRGRTIEKRKREKKKVVKRGYFLCKRGKSELRRQGLEELGGAQTS